MASKAVVTSYFEGLKQTLQEHSLSEDQVWLVNVDEKGISIDYKSPYIVSGSDHCPLAITSGKGKTVTILGCGSMCCLSWAVYAV